MSILSQLKPCERFERSDLEKLLDLLGQRNGPYVEFHPGRGWTQPKTQRGGRWTHSPFTVEGLMDHLYHRKRIAVPLPNPARVLALDLDAKTGSPDELARIDSVLEVLRNVGLQAYVETSKSGRGVHVYARLDSLVQGRQVSRVVGSFLESNGHRVRKGALEIFNGIRNRLAVPFFAGAEYWSLQRPSVRRRIRNEADGYAAYRLFQSLPANSLQRFSEGPRQEQEISERPAPRISRPARNRELQPLGFAYNPARDGWVLRRIEWLYPQGITRRGERNRITYAVAERLVRDGLQPDRIIPPLWRWLQKYRENSHDLSTRPTSWSRDNLRQQVGNAYSIHRKRVGPNGPRLKADPRHVRVLLALEIPRFSRGLAEAASKVLQAFKTRGMVRGDLVALSNKYLAAVTGYGSSNSFWAIRWALVAAGTVALTTPANKRFRRAPIYQIRRLYPRRPNRRKNTPSAR